ncbi:hypothetical protein E6O75_ATG06281 [Venturia nashicola]|uniref:Large ribosomal subunit protein mL67 n=1 Tax=Venturia nashicola TaxID=86259 RepID=A0A4Z1P2N8_9PEZI|nr:hypothetical protein E6O75_ATG06281 [Venturia nashicola]
MSHLSKIQKRRPGHGKTIWLFSHIKTHQVLCSLSQYPEEKKMLKQLTFYGKQTQAQEIRRDLFRPFAAVYTPSPEFGMNVYQKLREYRHVRDYQWTFRPTTKEIEETVKKAIEEERMPKFDNRLPTLKERAKLLMDQKAATIADLCHILWRETESAQKAKNLERGRTKRAKKIKNAKWAQVQTMAARARAGELQKYNFWVKRRQDAIEAADSDKDKALGKKGLMMLKIKRNELLRAKEAVDFVSGRKVPLAQRLNWNQNLRAMVQSRTTRIVNPEKPPPPPEEPRAPEPDIRQQQDGYSGEDEILIQWKDMTDGYYANEWPPEVMHGNLDIKYLGNESVLNDDLEAEADLQEEAVREPKEERKGSFMGKFMDTMRAPFKMNSVKADGEEARR